MCISDVKYFKIHPAIGVARIANNEDYFEFYEAHAKNFSPASDYMSGGGSSDPDIGKLRMKRQAVQFTVFAYGSDNQLIGKVKELFPDVQLSWKANVGNRKLRNYSEKKGGALISPITAEATADSPGVHADLNGVSPWDSSTTVNLGTITGTGLFIPPKGGVTRKNSGSVIDRYPANQSGDLQCTDTSCDGQISATISENGAILDKPVIGAWVLATPSQHALTLTPVMAANMNDNFGSFDPQNNNANENWIHATKSLLQIQGSVYDPTGLDLPMMDTMNADYNPGMEINIGDLSRIENGVKPKNFFYPRNSEHINKDEIRVEIKENLNGAIPGQLTSGLCSTWQGDMSACLNYWTAENPNQAYGTNGQVETVIYKESNPKVTMSNPEEINKDMDFRGIVDYENVGDDIKLNIVYDPNRPSTAIVGEEALDNKEHVVGVKADK